MSRRTIYEFICDDCKSICIQLDARHGLVRIIRMLRDKGWVVSRNRRSCICPICVERRSHD